MSTKDNGCTNDRPCTCKNTDCDNYRKCCACVANHRNLGNVPNCFKKEEES